MQILLDIILFIFYSMIFIMLCVYCYNFLMATFELDNSTDTVLLEFKIPRDVFKSPLATEMSLLALLQGGGVSTWNKRNIVGNGVATFSLEIASLEGEIHFYIRTQSKFRQLIENNFYANYPGIEIVEAPDYVQKIYYDHRSKNVSLWGLENKLSEKFKLIRNNKNRLPEDKIRDDDLTMPADCLPIKTYVDFEMDKDPKDIFKHDPLAPMLEWMGSIGKGEYIWHQIILQDAGKFDGKNFDKTYFNEKTGEEFNFNELTEEYLNAVRTKPKNIIKIGDEVYDDYGNLKTVTIYKEIAKLQPDGSTKIEKIPEQVPLKYGDKYFTSAEKEQGFKIIEEKLKDSDQPTEKQNAIKAVLKKKSKPILRAVIRTLYLGQSEYYNGGSNVNSILSYSKLFGPSGYNSFAPIATDNTDYSWQNTKGRRVPWRSEFFFLEYVERGGMSSHLQSRNNEPKGWKSDLLDFLPFSIGSYSLDKWFDVYFFRFSLRTRFIVRSMIEKFFYPFDHPRIQPMTLNLEEIATLWHIPSSSVTTPGLKRIGSTKSSAPDYLPR